MKNSDRTLGSVQKNGIRFDGRGLESGPVMVGGVFLGKLKISVHFRGFEANFLSNIKQ